MANGKMRIRALRCLAAAAALSAFVWSVGSLARYGREARESQTALETMQALAVEGAAAPIGPEEGESSLSEPSEEGPPIQVDLDKAREVNEDIVAWIYCQDTPISFPVLRSRDNQDYLDRLPDGTRNANGSIFLDFRNAPDFSGRNSILYGHNMKSGAMFASITRYRDPAYYETHPTLYLFCGEETYRVALFAAGTVSADSPLYGEDAEAAEAAIAALLRSSPFSSGVTPLPEDRLLTLSTCSYAYQDARFVLMGRLVPLAQEASS